MKSSTFPSITWQRHIFSWCVHILTASSAVVGLYTLKAIYDNQFILAFWLMGLTIFIDAIDGTLARYIEVKLAVPKIDGALLDNIMDYLNYVITPSFMLLVSDMLHPSWRGVVASVIVFVSAYQFTQSDAKTEDHFFKGFPCYWNIVVFYLYIFNLSPNANVIVLLILALLVFVPTKYIHPFRLNYLTPVTWLRNLMFFSSLLYAAATIGLLWLYPNKNMWLIAYSSIFIVFYLGFSLYRTFVPLFIARRKNGRPAR